MKASARIVAEADGRGGTRLAVLRCESPLLLRRTGPVTVHLVGGAAGPLPGDLLRFDIEVGAGARLDVRSVAASLALPGRPGAAPSRLEITAAVEPGGWLRWLPQPLIAAAGCDHRVVTRVEVAAGAWLLWRDDLVCGRHGEGPGDVRAETTIRYAGSTLYRHDLAVGPAAPGWSGAAVLGGGRAVGSVVFAGAGLPPPAMPARDAAVTPDLPGGDAALMPLTGHGADATLMPLTGHGADATLMPLTGHGADATLMPLTGHGRDAALLPLTGQGADAAIMPLAGPGVLAMAVGADIRQVRAALDPLCAPPSPALPIPTR